MSSSDTQEKMKLDKLESSGMGLLIFCNEAKDCML